MRLGLASAIAILALGGCSPVAHIQVDVRSPSDISFMLSTEKEDRACIDHLVIRAADGDAKWEVTRQSGNTVCVQAIAFPNAPSGFTSQKSASALTVGAYEVSAESSVYRGVAKFTVQ